jgi:hypothetical protein
MRIYLEFKKKQWNVYREKDSWLLALSLFLNLNRIDEASGKLKIINIKSVKLRN